MGRSGRAGVSGSRGDYCSRHVDLDRDIATDALAHKHGYRDWNIGRNIGRRHRR